MKLPTPIDIDLKDFILCGRFDFLELEQTRAWVRANFPDPDGGDVGGRIWTYGNIELHFTQDGRLWLIYTDGIGRVSGGPSLRVAPWKLNDGLQLGQWMQLLADEGAAFSVAHQPGSDLVILLVAESGVRLQFSVRAGALLASPLGAVSLR